MNVFLFQHFDTVLLAPVCRQLSSSNCSTFLRPRSRSNGLPVLFVAHVVSKLSFAPCFVLCFDVMRHASAHSCHACMRFCNNEHAHLVDNDTQPLSRGALRTAACSRVFAGQPSSSYFVEVIICSILSAIGPASDGTWQGTKKKPSILVKV
jgi:hypothetical protein